MAPYYDTLKPKLDYFDDAQCEQIKAALEYSQQAHEGQYRRSGEPYVTHPIAVAGILADMQLDHQSIMAALLHDVIEDTVATRTELEQRFSATVADLVEGVSKISAIKFETHAQAQAENFRKMVLAMSKDIRVVIVKLADRLHNMRTLSVLKSDKRRRIAKETLEIYAPIANRLGMNDFRMEYEDLGFSVLYPMRAKRISEAVKRARGNRKELMSNLEERIKEAFERAQLTCRLIGREKHLYSIYQKMRSQRKSFGQIMDVFGFRIIVNSVDDCYRALGVMHNLDKPIPGRFKDYIAIPKTNGYQSLHTTVIGPVGTPIEIQIRTEEMDALGNNGIAAHWLYKSRGQPNHKVHARAQDWLAGLMEMQKTASSSLEFIENVKFDLFPDEVYLFTPKGNILELPTGACPVDFAYAVHTDIGNACVAARVDHRLAPLSAPLESGQTVEIITSRGAKPNSVWLSFVVTGKARSNIRHHLKTQRKKEARALGQNLLTKALADYGLNLDELAPERLTLLLNAAQCDQLDDLLEEIGTGQRIAPVIAHQINYPDIPTPSAQPTQPTLAIRGTEGLAIEYAPCCLPIPGDKIVGYLDAKGLVIHRNECLRMMEQSRSPDRCLSVDWSEHIDAEFSVGLTVELENRRGALADLANIVAQCQSNIDDVSMGGDRNSALSTVKLKLTVKDSDHLARIIRRLRFALVASKIART